MFYIIVLLTYLSIVQASNPLGLTGPPNFIYQDFYDCAGHPTPINFSVKAEWFNKTYQVLSGVANTPVPVGDNLLMKVVVDVLVHDNWVHLTNISAKTCQVLRNYIGPLRTVLYAAIGLPPNTCPIPKGVYHGRNVHFDMKESRIPAFPYGDFKMRMELFDIKNVLQLCLGIRFENKPE